MQLVLNELSVSETPQNAHDAEKIFNTFLSTYSALIGKYHNISRSIISPVDFNSLYIAPNYCVAQWRNSNIDPDLRRRFLGLCEHIKQTNPSEDELICETTSGKAGKGIQLASEYVTPLISFSFSEDWKLPQIPCNIYHVEDENIEEGVFLYNFSTNETIIDNNEWLQTELQKSISEIKTPAKLLENLQDLFPSLYFIDYAKRQIAYDLTAVTVPIVVEKLSKLEEYFSTWDGNIFEPQILPPRTISPESKETLTRFKKEHTFLYNEQEILVSYHMRYTGGNIPGRIYFFPDHKTKKGIVCSLTTKLPTVKNPKSSIR